MRDFGHTIGGCGIDDDLPSGIADTSGTVALNHSERGILRKLLGRSFKEIQETADEEGKSLEQFVREGTRYYARRIRA